MSNTCLSQELRGKSIISVTNGEVIGRVVDVLIDPAGCRVGALVTSKGGFLTREIKALPGDVVQVWGQDVILVSRSDVIAKKEELIGHKKWMSAADKIKGHDVIGTDGRRLGELNDVVLNNEGRIVAYELSHTGNALAEVFTEESGKPPERIPVEATHSFGQDVLIVDVNQLSQLLAAQAAAKAEAEGLPDEVEISPELEESAADWEPVEEPVPDNDDISGEEESQAAITDEEEPFTPAPEPTTGEAESPPEADEAEDGEERRF